MYSYRGVSCGLCRVRVCVPIFRVRGLSVHNVSEKRTGEKPPPLAPIPRRKTVCTSLAPFLCRPPRASIARGPEQELSPLGPLRANVKSRNPLRFKKRSMSCRPLRVRSLLVGCTVRHIGTSCVRWSASASLHFAQCLQGFPRTNALREFLSLTVLSDSAPSSEFLHQLAHDTVYHIMYEVPPRREIWRNYPQDSRTCDERSQEPTPKKPGPWCHTEFDCLESLPLDRFMQLKKPLTVTCGPL